MDRVFLNYDLDNSDTFLSYLPMSHIMEMLCDVSIFWPSFFSSLILTELSTHSPQIICFMVSVKIAYGKPATLITGGPLLAKGCIGDVQASQLTLWVL